MSRKLLPKNRPSYVSTFIDGGVISNPKPIITHLKEPDRLDTIDILKEYLCKPDEYLGVDFDNMNAFQKRSDMGDNVYSLKYRSGTLNTGLSPGENIYLEKTTFNFPKNYKFVGEDKSSNTLYLAFMDNSTEISMGSLSGYGEVKDNYLGNSRIYRRYFNWTSLSYEKGKHIVVKPNSDKKNCVAFVVVDSVKDDIDLIYSPDWNKYYNTKPNKKFNIDNKNSNFLLLVFHLYDYDKKVSLRENIIRYRVTLTNDKRYALDRTSSNWNRVKNSIVEPSYFVNRVGGNISGGNHFGILYNSSVNDGDWILYGDDKFFYMGVKNFSSNNHFFTSFSFGELDDILVEDTCFIMNGYTGYQTQDNFFYSTYNHIPNISVGMYGCSCTSIGNNKEVIFYDGRDYSVVYSNQESSIFANINVNLPKTIKSNIIQHISPFLNFRSSAKIKVNNLWEVKLINGEPYLLIRNGSENAVENFALPLTKSFRYQTNAL